MKIQTHNIEKVFASKKMSEETAKAKGYKLLATFFVDSSGFGADDEAALTRNQFLEQLETFLKKHKKPVYSFITNAGQFQVYVGIFEKTGKKNSRIVAGNTLEIMEGNKRTIRLHGTDILIFENGKIKLDSGGFRTQTTKTRMNEFLPFGFSVFNKKGNWFIQTPKKTIDFADGITV